MSGVRLGDPAECSQLGGMLRTRAAEVADRVRDLTAAPGPDPRLARRLAQTETLAEGLDRLGTAVQAHAQRIAELGRAHQRLQQDVHDAGLVLDHWRVSEPAGPVAAEVALGRRRQQPALQRRVEAFGAEVTRTRAALTSACDQAQQTLAALSSVIIDE